MSVSEGRMHTTHSGMRVCVLARLHATAIGQQSRCSFGVMGSQAQRGHVTLSNMYMNCKNDKRRAQIPTTATGLILWLNEKVFSDE